MVVSLAAPDVARTVVTALGYIPPNPYRGLEPRSSMCGVLPVQISWFAALSLLEHSPERLISSWIISAGASLRTSAYAQLYKLEPCVEPNRRSVVQQRS